VDELYDQAQYKEAVFWILNPGADDSLTGK
jgi:hypothetical protein